MHGRFLTIPVSFVADVFNTVINCWAKSKEPDAASKAEEMLVAMSRLHSSGMTSLKPDAFTFTAVIDACK